jgi:hypothetical protein
MEKQHALHATQHISSLETTAPRIVRSEDILILDQGSVKNVHLIARPAQMPIHALSARIVNIYTMVYVSQHAQKNSGLQHQECIAVSPVIQPVKSVRMGRTTHALSVREIII